MPGIVKHQKAIQVPRNHPPSTWLCVSQTETDTCVYNQPVQSPCSRRQCFAVKQNWDEITVILSNILWEFGIWGASCDVLLSDLRHFDSVFYVNLKNRLVPTAPRRLPRVHSDIESPTPDILPCHSRCTCRIWECSLSGRLKTNASIFHSPNENQWQQRGKINVQRSVGRSPPHLSPTQNNKSEWAIPLAVNSWEQIPLQVVWLSVHFFINHTLRGYSL